MDKIYYYTAHTYHTKDLLFHLYYADSSYSGREGIAFVIECDTNDQNTVWKVQTGASVTIRKLTATGLEGLG